MNELCSQSFLEWFLLLKPCGDFHDRITTVFNAVLPELPRIMAIQYWLWPCLTLGVFMMDNEIWSVNFTLKEHYSKVFCRLVNLCPSLHLRNSASLRGSLYTQSSKDRPKSPPCNVQDLKDLLVKSWCQIPHHTFGVSSGVHASMALRCFSSKRGNATLGRCS